MNIDEILIKNSNWAWNKLREARKLGFQLGEESITDFLILNIKKLGGTKLIVESFTRHKESVNGADWEWWFTGPSGKWLGMRIQAKVLKLDSEKYEHLHHHNKNGKQVDLLVQDAIRGNMVPTYCMYTNWDPSKYDTPWKCKTHKTSVRHYGTALLSTSKVRQLQATKETRLSMIINSLRPMHCIFCCSGHGGTDLPSRALNYAKSTGLLDSMMDNAEPKNSDNFEVLLRDRPPFYVEQLLEGGLEDSFIDVNDQRLKTITVFIEAE
ncbi:hypothetical protein SAMN02745127_01526 [Oceanospirillum multiglobuliferum]|uniref:Uncharacterized protein n=1 Tax=Oceanospirillum multiglobuliferum TaxID=64969 RepID=A0A1T4PMB6_9GAMM|nr:DUF6615 family protein [Oceanospirillum multiglobuliferum]OPX54101.1 hypothetical protein BTE48_16020 [Oceanospirillum multiglobuliferum]SJZ92619.1 hypothetical protein SAMN02745127_01526 [Oceanospirillum multiglobuliferum]